jgi:hypothetical protein
LVTLKDVITRLDPDSLPAQALEGEQSQLISVVKSLSPYCNAISNILFSTRMITASLDKAPRIKYATDDDSSTKFRFRPNLANNKQHRRRRHHHRHPSQSKEPMDHAPGLRTTTRAGPPTKKKKNKKSTASSTINKIDTQRNSKANSRISNAITTSHKKEHRDKTKNKGIKRLRPQPSNRSTSAGGKRKTSHPSNTSSSKRPLMPLPNVALQFQKAIMQKMIQQERQSSTSSALFYIFSSIIQQGAMSEKIVNLEHQYIADPPRIFKALGYATATIPITLTPASASINLHSIARRTILPFLNIQQPSKEDTTRADENETIFDGTTISKEQQQQYVQPIRSTSSAVAQKLAAHRRNHNVMKIPSRLGSVIASFFGAGHIMRGIRTSSQILSSPSMTAASSSATTTANSRVNSFEPLLKRGFLPLHNTLMASFPSVAAIVGGVGEGGEEATALDRAAHDKARIVKSESSREIGGPFQAKRTPESIKGEDGKVTPLPSNEIAFQLPTHNILSKMLSRIISNVNVARADDEDDKSTDAELLPPIFLHKDLFRNVMTSIEKISTRMAMPMQQQIASGVKGQAKEKADVEISQKPTRARVDDMVTGQPIDRLLYDEYGKENIQSAAAAAAAAYSALRSRVDHPLHFPIQLMSSPTSIVTEGVKRVLATSIRSIFQEQNTIIPSITLPSAVKDRFDVAQKITINPYYTRQQMHGPLESTTPVRLSSFSGPAAKNASQPTRRYLPHVYSKKEENEEDIAGYEFENMNLESKELQKQQQQQQQLLVNPVTELQREYSKYILQNAIYNPGKDQSILLTATRPSQSKPLLSITKTTTGMRERRADVRKSSSSSSSSQYANMAKIDNSSINLPVVSQLQVMLANQYADNSDHDINSLALLPQRQILSSPIPQAYVAQRLVTSFGSTAGKQVSTIGINETNGKMLNERSSSTLMGESTESRFGQDNSSSRSSSSRSATKIEQEDTNKGISLRQLRKMMEQIFHEELKRYGL